MMIATQESVTAKLCSFARAFHSNFERQKIFDDYLAYDIMGKTEYEEMGQLIAHDFAPERYDPNDSFRREQVHFALHHYISPIPLSRSAYAEEALQRFAQQYGMCQYVICGAGMDTFAFRNDNPAIQVFELDHPDTQRYKLEKIRQLCWNIPTNAHYVPVDFAAHDMTAVLQRAGYDSAGPTFFTILGVTYYLTLPVLERTVQKISSLSKGGDELVFDYPDETTFRLDGAERVHYLAQITARLGEPMQQGFQFEALAQMLERHRFSVHGHMTPGEIQGTFFQSRRDGQRAFENIHFITAVKQSEDH